MEQTLYIVRFFTETVQTFVWEYRIPVLTILGVIGFVAYKVGDGMRKQNILLAAQTQATSSPYKPVALSLIIFGVALMIISAIMLYFAGGYAALFAKLGW